MKRKLFNVEYRAAFLNRRLDRAYSWAVKKGLNPVEYMRESLDSAFNHLIDLKH